MAISSQSPPPIPNICLRSFGEKCASASLRQSRGKIHAVRNLCTLYTLNCAHAALATLAFMAFFMAFLGAAATAFLAAFFIAILLQTRGWERGYE